MLEVEKACAEEPSRTTTTSTTNIRPPADAAVTGFVGLLLRNVSCRFMYLLECTTATMNTLSSLAPSIACLLMCTGSPSVIAVRGGDGVKLPDEYLLFTNVTKSVSILKRSTEAFSFSSLAPLAMFVSCCWLLLPENESSPPPCCYLRYYCETRTCETIKASYSRQSAFTNAQRRDEAH